MLRNCEKGSCILVFHCVSKLRLLARHPWILMCWSSELVTSNQVFMREGRELAGKHQQPWVQGGGEGGSALGQLPGGHRACFVVFRAPHSAAEVEYLDFYQESLGCESDLGDFEALMKGWRKCWFEFILKRPQKSSLLQTYPPSSHFKALKYYNKFFVRFLS